MRKRKMDELAIYQLQNKMDAINIELLHDLYIEKTSDIVYLILDNKLYGIICLEDLLHGMIDGVVTIVKDFIRINRFSDEEAREIFISRQNIHKIPVVNEEGKLLGDYSRWDDIQMPYIQWLKKQTSTWHYILKKYLREKGYQKIYIVSPVKEKVCISDIIAQILRRGKVDIALIDKAQLSELLEENEKSLVITVDIDELRGIRCIDGFDYYASNTKLVWGYFSGLWIKLKKYEKPERLGHYSIVNEGDGIKELFGEMQKKGINIVTFYNDVYYMSDYIKALIKKIGNDTKKTNPNVKWLAPEKDDFLCEEFLGDLLQNKDYASGAAQRNIELRHVLQREWVDTYVSRYFNIIDGHRKTWYQPELYEGKIYMFGHCIFTGAYQEDQYTVASLLQKKLENEGYHYCVENYGAPRNVLDVMRKITYHQGDIIIVWTGEHTIEGLDTVEMRRTYEKYNVPAEWFLDALVHVNHKITGIIANELFGEIEKYLKRENKEKCIGHEDDVSLTFSNYANYYGNYIKSSYLNRYFSVEDIAQISSREGGIIVDLDLSPTIYEEVLRKARAVVKHIVVFIPNQVADTKYSLAEHIVAMENNALQYSEIQIVPGEDYVPYCDLLPSYYSGTALNIEDVRNEIQLFAECIARPLNIKYRFDYGQHTNEKMILYSQVMKEELPKYGIEYIEFL